MREFRTMAYEEGRRQALALREEAPNLTQTQLIAREREIPAFDPGKDYTQWPRGSAVTDGGQVWLLLIPHNAAHHTGRPHELRSLWGLAHTKDPSRAKAWVAPLGDSGVYAAGECCVWGGRVWRSLTDSNAYPPQTQGAMDHWEEVIL